MENLAGNSPFDKLQMCSLYRAGVRTSQGSFCRNAERGREVLGWDVSTRRLRGPPGRGVFAAGRPAAPRTSPRAARLRVPADTRPTSASPLFSANACSPAPQSGEKSFFFSLFFSPSPVVLGKCVRVLVRRVFMNACESPSSFCHCFTVHASLF